MVEICLQFLRAKYTGNLQLQLDMSRMTLPYFASFGHHRYQKSVYLHLQTMSQIHVTHPDLNKHFMNVLLHVIRRSGRFWTGLSPGLVIEQDLIRSLKASGDLTRGRGTKICSKIPFSKNSYQIETCQLNCLANQLTGFYMRRVFIERYFQIDYIVHLLK